MAIAATREVLSEHDVLALLNFEISAYEECADCHFIAVKPAPIADTTGCNWRGADVKYGGQPSDAVRSITQRVVDEVRERYNVA